MDIQQYASFQPSFEKMIEEKSDSFHFKNFQLRYMYQSHKENYIVIISAKKKVRLILRSSYHQAHINMCA